MPTSAIIESAIDEKGFVKPGYPILIYLPAWDAYVPLLVKTRANLGYERFEYGPLPVEFPNYEPGVMPPNTRVEGLTFRYSELPPEFASDMFYYTEKDRLIHVYAEIRPSLLRILLEIPQGSKPYSLYGLVPQSLTRDFGWFRCCKELVFPPRIHVGWDFYNPTNLALRTHVHFDYAEYIIEPLLDVEAVTRILAGKAPAHVVPFGGMNKFREMDIALQTWGAVMVPRPPAWYKEDEIRRLVQQVLKA